MANARRSPPAKELSQEWKARFEPQKADTADPLEISFNNHAEIKLFEVHTANSSSKNTKQTVRIADLLN